MNNYVKKIVSDYCVLDTETTGLSAYYDEVIEIGILKVRSGDVTDRYEQLIRPKYEIDGFITSLTGITNEMVADKPPIEDVKGDVLAFLENDIIVAHNASFDVRFLAAGFQENINNEYMDTMQFARKLYHDLPHHRLSDLSEYLNLTNNEHRAIADCVTTMELYEAMKTEMAQKGLGIRDLWQVNSSGHSGIDIGAITATTDDIDEDGFFYGRHVVFTGKLERMTRKEAMQIVVNMGGILDNSVNKHTNYLILGNNDYNAVLHREKSSKHKKAEKLKLEGQDIDIIDEFTFYDIINGN